MPTLHHVERLASPREGLLAATIVGRHPPDTQDVACTLFHSAPPAILSMPHTAATRSPNQSNKIKDHGDLEISPTGPSAESSIHSIHPRLCNVY